MTWVGRDRDSGIRYLSRENLQTFTVWKIHKTQIQAPIGFLPSLSPPMPVLNPVTAILFSPPFVFANYLSSSPPLFHLQFIHSVSQSSTKCPFVHRHSREKLVGCKVDDDDDDGSSERLSQVYLDGRGHGRAKSGLSARVRKCTHCTNFITYSHFIAPPCDVSSSLRLQSSLSYQV